MEINLESQEEPPASPMQISEVEQENLHPDKLKTTTQHNNLAVPMMSDNTSSSNSSVSTTTASPNSLRNSINNSPRRRGNAATTGHRRKTSKTLKPVSPRDLQLKKGNSSLSFSLLSTHLTSSSSGRGIPLLILSCFLYHQS
jgi:phosphatidate phosphatase PAH1